MAEEKGTSLLAYIREHDVLNTEQDAKKQAQQESTRIRIRIRRRFSTAWHASKDMCILLKIWLMKTETAPRC